LRVRFDACRCAVVGVANTREIAFGHKVFDREDQSLTIVLLFLQQQTSSFGLLRTSDRHLVVKSASQVLPSSKPPLPVTWVPGPRLADSGYGCESVAIVLSLQWNLAPVRTFVYQRLGGKEDSATSDARAETQRVRLEAME
jgi:hypothetical protein